MPYEDPSQKLPHANINIHLDTQPGQIIRAKRIEENVDFPYIFWDKEKKKQKGQYLRRLEDMQGEFIIFVDDDGNIIDVVSVEQLLHAVKTLQKKKS